MTRRSSFDSRAILRVALAGVALFAAACTSPGASPAASPAASGEMMESPAASGEMMESPSP